MEWDPGGGGLLGPTDKNSLNEERDGEKRRTTFHQVNAESQLLPFQRVSQILKTVLLGENWPLSAGLGQLMSCLLTLTGPLCSGRPLQLWHGGGKRLVNV